MEIVAYKGRVYGRVQGVGFRYFTQEQAVMLDIVGHVKNMSDDSVEFFIQGSNVKCEKLLTKIQSGPPFAKVEAFDCSPADLDSSCRVFDILY